MTSVDEKKYQQWMDDQVAQFLKGTIWKCGTDNSGRKFYYDKVAKKSQWKAPPEVLEFEKTLSRDRYLTTTSIPVGPKTKEELLSILNSKDSILDPDIVAVSKSLINDHQVSAVEVKAKLTDNYVGYPSMIKIALQINRLTSLLEAEQRQASTSRYTSASTTAQRIAHIQSDAFFEEQLMPTLAELVSQRFNRRLADGLVGPPSEVGGLPVLPEYVHRMAQHPSLRQTLLELYQTHQQSTFLRACCTGEYTVQAAEDGPESVTTSGAVTAAPVEAAKALTQAGQVTNIVDASDRVVLEAKQFLRVRGLLSSAVVSRAPNR